jgi:uncharacterized protein YcbX
MGGEKLQATLLSNHGVVGDRCYALHDGTTIRGAKKFTGLMSLQASYDNEPEEDVIPDVTIDLNNTAISSGDPQINEVLSREVGTSVTLDRIQPADNLDYYKTPSVERSKEDMMAIFGLEEGEPFPDFSEFPKEAFAYASPPGTFFDAYPLLVLTTNAIARLQSAAPDTRIDERRFRPNIVIDASDQDDGYIEEQWKGKFLAIGKTVVELMLPCPRCVMTTIGFGDLPREPKIMRALVKENHHKLGIYARVVKPGKISANDPVELQKRDNFSRRMD